MEFLDRNWIKYAQDLYAENIKPWWKNSKIWINGEKWHDHGLEHNTVNIVILGYSINRLNAIPIKIQAQ